MNTGVSPGPELEAALERELRLHFVVKQREGTQNSFRRPSESRVAFDWVDVETDNGQPVCERGTEGLAEHNGR